MTCDERDPSGETAAGQGRLDLFCFSPPVISFRPASSPRRSRPAQDDQIIGDHPQPDQSLHAVEAPSPTPPEPMTALQDAGPPLAAGPPPQRPAKPALALVRAPGRRQPAARRQGHPASLSAADRTLVGNRQGATGWSDAELLALLARVKIKASEYIGQHSTIADPCQPPWPHPPLQHRGLKRPGRSSQSLLVRHRSN